MILKLFPQEESLLKLILLGIADSKNFSSKFNPFQSSVAFHIKTSHLISIAKQMTGIYMKRNKGLKSVQSTAALSTEKITKKKKFSMTNHDFPIIFALISLILAKRFCKNNIRGRLKILFLILTH